MMSITKRFLNSLLIMGILFYNFSSPIKIQAASVSLNNCKNTHYKVASGTKDIACYTTYNEALNSMNNYPSKLGDVAYIIYMDKIINAKYAIVKLDTKSVTENINIYNTEYGTGYVNGFYGVDAAFLGYDSSKKRIKIKISGVVGYINESDGEIVPLNSSNSSFKIITEELRFRNSISLANNTIIIDGMPLNSVVEILNPIPTLKYGYEWYKVKYENIIGYIANNPKEPYLELVSEKSLLDTYYYKKNGNLYHQFVYNSSGRKIQNLYLGPAPSFLKDNVNYYSFDGIYFYTSIVNMLDDYKTGSNSKAYNKSPYYNYYLYLPYRTYSSVTANNLNDFIKSLNYTTKINRHAYYEFQLTENVAVPGIEECDAISNKTSKRECINNKRIATGKEGKWVDVTVGENFIANGSMLYNEGAAFVNSQTTYGTNALLTFSIAINESAYGRSHLAVTRYNIFGHKAYDSNPSAATEYDSINTAIMYHADRYASENYSNPATGLYNGSHLGNKGSGMNVKYASDPYWGEKAAANYASVVSKLDIDEFQKVTIGIKQIKNAVKVRYEPKTASKELYEIKSISNVPVVVLDKVTGQSLDGNNIWYKIQTDPSLKANGDYFNPGPYYPGGGEYNKNHSIGYVHSSLIYLATNISDVRTMPDVDFLSMLQLSKTGNYVRGYNIETKISGVKNKVAGKAEITVRDNNNNIKTDASLIATGDTIEVTNSEGSNSYTFVMYGDLNGDGKVSSADLLRMRQHLLGLNKLKGVYLESAELTDDAKVSSADLLRMRQHLLGIKKIRQ